MAFNGVCLVWKWSPGSGVCSQKCWTAEKFDCSTNPIKNDKTLTIEHIAKKKINVRNFSNSIKFPLEYFRLVLLNCHRMAHWRSRRRGRQGTRPGLGAEGSLRSNRGALQHGKAEKCWLNIFLKNLGLVGNWIFIFIIVRSVNYLFLKSKWYEGIFVTFLPH